MAHYPRLQTLHTNKCNSSTQAVYKHPTSTKGYGASLVHFQTPRTRAIRINAVHEKRFALWGEENPNGKDVEFEEGIFEDCPPPTCRDVGHAVEVAETRLVPERWKGLQEELNRSKKEKRSEILKNKLTRAKEEKAKLREKLSSVIEEGIAKRKQQQASEKQREKARTLRAVTDDFEREGGEDDSDVEAELVPPAIFEKRRGRTERSDDEGREYPPADILGDEIDRLRARGRTPRKAQTEEDDFTLLRKVYFSPAEKKIFKDRKLDLDKLFSEKWMPLHALARAGQTYLLAELLDQGARVDDLDKEGATALFRAVQAGKLGVSRHLIKRGANIHFRDKHGATLLHHGAASGNPTIVKLLLKYGVDINAVDEEGWTSLHVAVQSQKKSIVRSLLKRGADRTIANKDENKPLDLAFAFAAGYNSNAVIRLLKSQLPVLESMKGFKSCDEIAAKLLSDAEAGAANVLFELGSECSSDEADVEDCTSEEANKD